MATNDVSNDAPTVILGSCRYKNQLHIISIKSNSTIMEIYGAIINKWNHIHPDALILQYLAPRERLYVTLGSDEDVENMVALHLIMKMSVVDIVVIRKDEANSRGKRVRTDGWEDKMEESLHDCPLCYSSD
ncbi:PREDICTED: uncharacterized protein LOC105963612 [Erythranthe guttata]|uniref:uncharacterized protein LOC105963612 n=1 Tax=Erythranthe guttata TaxID=4155 RepID=UPI00064DDBEB|nr:PREDICTED: uncharacterized protein LOC105963612 [Erythranthe guttata]|eukprot:XP_012843486.1 PREDICTED: uncharacterized protein LOC105963612 [Erythranthe guttata]